MPVRTPALRTSAALAAGLLATLLAAGCGESDDPSVATSSTPTTAAASPNASTGSPSPTPAASVSTPSADVEIILRITKRRVDPPTGRVTVAKGELVRITVTSDVPDELHVHGYDLGARLPAGTPGSVEFRADKTGLFEVETHETELVLVQLVVR